MSKKSKNPLLNFWEKWTDMANEALPPNVQQWQDYFSSFIGTPLNEHWLFGARRFKPWQTGDFVFNPFLSALLSKNGGLLPLYTLHLLEEAPRYGNEIINILVERTAEQGSVNPAAVYPLLNELEREDFVVAEWDDPKKRTTKRYTITRKGHDELLRLKAIMRPKLQATVHILQEIVDELSADADFDDVDNT